MTSDAKVGLLLGLVFIFIIAFIINGLPRFRGDTSNNELTTTLVSQQDQSPGIGDKERKAQEVFNRAKQATKELADEVQRPAEKEQDIRFEIPLPERASVAKKDEPFVKTTDDQPQGAASVPIADDKTQAEKPEAAKPALPKIYVVAEGDNLAAIAQKCYGAQEGNRKINVVRIFQANRELLKSPDEIYVGQKLTIPPLTSTPDNDKIESVLPETVFEKVESIGKRWLSADQPKANKAQQSRQYVVREGDSLWQIAAQRLGDGSRYKELIKLNDDILEDENTLAVGMRLRLPAR